MCKISKEEIEAMTDEELAEHISSHRAAHSCAHSPESELIRHADAHYEKIARENLKDFVEQETERGKCDPMRVKREVFDGRIITSAQTYVLTPDVVDDIVRRLKDRAWKLGAVIDG